MATKGSRPMMTSGKWVLSGTVLALALAGCGGGGGDDASPAQAAPAGAGNGSASVTTPAGSTSGGANADASVDRFTRKATWTVAAPAAGKSVCYDYDTATEVAGCTGSAWDLKLTGGQRSISLFTNSGPSGSGNGGVNIATGDGMPTWDYLKTWKNGLTEPASGQSLPVTRIYFPDSTTGAFSGTNEIGTAAFEYSLTGDHKMYPTYRVFLVTSNRGSDSTKGSAAAPVFALQVTGFYGGANQTTSGYPSFRWVNRAESAAAVRTAQVNATEQGKWVYFDLNSGTETSESGNWQIAFSRYRIRLNKQGNLGAVVGMTHEGFYDAKGKPVVAALSAATPESTLADLTAAALPETAKWLVDQENSRLNLAAPKANANGTFDFGWYTYYMTAEQASAARLSATAHILGANANKGQLIRGGEGNSYARFHLTNIAYQNASDATSPQTWSIDFEVQPAAQ